LKFGVLDGFNPLNLLGSERMDRRTMRREIEAAILVVISYICVAAGMKIDDANYKVFLFLMAGMFALALFRPRRLP
jgi:hypothetical protein